MVRVDVESGTIAIVPIEAAIGTGAVWSRTGEQIVVFGRENNLIVVDIDSGSITGISGRGSRWLLSSDSRLKCRYGFKMLDRLWSRRTHEAVNTLSVDAGLCVFGERRTWLTAVETATGIERWSVKVRDSHGWLAFTTSNVLYLNGHRYLVAFDRETGDQVWSHQLADISGWLHGFDQTAVVGGWRGYSDVVAFDSNEGRVLWTYPAKGSSPYCTKLHADSNSVAFCEQDGRLTFLNMRTGAVEEQRRTTADWNQHLERVNDGTTLGRPLILGGGVRHALSIHGPARRIEQVPSSAGMNSRDLTWSDGYVSFRTAAGEPAMYSLPERQLTTLGPSRLDRRGDHPFCHLGSGIFAIGTGNGNLAVYAGDPPSAISQQRLGKRISTVLARDNGALVLGTASGEVIALDISHIVADPAGASTV